MVVFFGEGVTLLLACLCGCVDVCVGGVVFLQEGHCLFAEWAKLGTVDDRLQNFRGHFNIL